jgi:hypothetical protein
MPLCYTVPDRREADTGMMISFLLVAAAFTAGSLLAVLIVSRQIAT